MAKIPENVLDALAQIPVFSGCTRKELQTVAHLGTPITVDPGYVFTRQGVRGFEFFICLDGTASCTIDGKRVADLNGGDVFGEMGLLEHEPCSATVVAETSMAVLVLDAREFGGMLAEAPSTAQKLLAILSHRLRMAQATS
jgi:CRP/FNR family transcriptional regulator, cyclic AMP receptor protein